MDTFTNDRSSTLLLLLDHGYIKLLIKSWKNAENVLILRPGSWNGYHLETIISTTEISILCVSQIAYMPIIDVTLCLNRFREVFDRRANNAFIIKQYDRVVCYRL